MPSLVPRGSWGEWWGLAGGAVLGSSFVLGLCSEDPERSGIRFGGVEASHGPGVPPCAPLVEWFSGQISGLESREVIFILALPITSQVTLDKRVNLPVP